MLMAENQDPVAAANTALAAVAAAAAPGCQHENQADATARTDHSAELKALNASTLAALRGAGAGRRSKAALAGGLRLNVRAGSVVDLGCEGVLNAANETLEGGGGVDAAVHAAAGPGLLVECLAVAPSAVQETGGAIEQGERCRCPVGEVRVTGAHAIPGAKRVLHTVAPLLNTSGTPNERLLRKCYDGALQVAEGEGLSSLALCALGTGFYGYPEVGAATVAIQAAVRFDSEQPTGDRSLQRVVFSTFGEQQHEVYERVLAQVLAAGVGCQWPPYCCAILTGRETPPQIFVEQRGADAAVAARRLTCFGGKREPGEHPLECIRRECQEEMGWAPRSQQLRRACDLFVDDQNVAWFYEVEGPNAAEMAQLVFEPGRSGVWVDAHDERISPWHATVLRAWEIGRTQADHTSSTEEDKRSTAELVVKLAAKHQAAAADLS